MKPVPAVVVKPLSSKYPPQIMQPAVVVVNVPEVTPSIVTLPETWAWWPSVGSASAATPENSSQIKINFRSITETMIVMLSLPFALVGGLWLMWWLGFNLSVAVAVGFIALAGVAAETGVVMLIYLNHALAEINAQRGVEGRAVTRGDLYDAIMEGAVERVRPKMMTVVAIMAGLLPIMWSTGTGSEIMQRIAVPMIGGMISSTLLTLIVIPAIFGLVKGFRLPPTDSGNLALGNGRDQGVLDRSRISAHLLRQSL